MPGGARLVCAGHAPGLGRGHLSLRPERIDLCVPGAGLMRATVLDHVYLGTDIQLRTRLVDGEEVVVRVQNAASGLPEVGAEVGLKPEAGAARLLVD